MRDIREEVEQISEIVSFPTILAEIQSSILDPDAASNQIADLISKDAVLTARVLAATNSPYYGLRYEVASIAHAVSLLGLEEVGRIVIVFYMKQRMYKLNAQQRVYLDQLWKHCVATAILAETIAKRVGIQDPGKIFTMGLLHDIGKIVIAQYYPDALALIQRMTEELQLKDVEAELQHIAVSHAEIGAQIATKWKLPAEFSEIIQAHHDPRSIVSVLHFAAIVRFADLLSEQCGIGIAEQPITFTLEEEDCWKILLEKTPVLAQVNFDDFIKGLVTELETKQSTLQGI